VTVGKRGRWPTAQTAFARTPTCQAQIACDGANLQGPRIALGTCGACGKAEKRKGQTVPLRGGEGWER
jgi:hypothetical protein